MSGFDILCRSGTKYYVRLEQMGVTPLNGRWFSPPGHKRRELSRFLLRMQRIERTVSEADGVQYAAGRWPLGVFAVGVAREVCAVGVYRSA